MDKDNSTILTKLPSSELDENEPDVSPRKDLPKEDHKTPNRETCKVGHNTFLPANVHTSSSFITCTPGIVTNHGPGDAEEMGTSTVADETPVEKCTCYTELPTVSELELRKSMLGVNKAALQDHLEERPLLATLSVSHLCPPLRTN